MLQAAQSQKKFQLELVSAPNNATPRLSMKRSLLKPRLDVPTDKTGVDYNTLIHELNDRLGVYHLLLDATLTPSLENASMPPPRYTQVGWSPPGLLYYGRCLLASLTNYGSVKVEYSYNHQWRQVIDVSESWAAVCSQQWEAGGRGRPQTSEQEYETLCEREAQLRIVAIAWSALRGKPPHGTYSLLAAAHRNGVVSLWTIPAVRLQEQQEQQQHPEQPPPQQQQEEEEEDQAPMTAGLAYTFDTKTTLICELLWLDLDEDHLLVGDGEGRVRMWEAAPGGDDRQPCEVYPTADRIKVSKLVVCPTAEGGSERLVFVIKNNYLVAVLVDATAQALGMDIHDFPHVALTGVVVTGPGRLVLSAREGAFYTVECSVEDGRPKLTATPLPNSINFTHNACFGLAASSHRMMWIAVSSVSKMYDHLVVKQPTTLSFMTVTDPSEAVPMLVQNSSCRLTQYTDCLEIVRVQSQKMGQRPPLDVAVEDLDPLSDYQLRLALWLTGIALTINADYEDEHTRQLKDLQHRMRQLLFARHACSRVEKMLAAVASRGATEDELNCINLLRTWMITFTETPVAAGHWKNTCARVSAILTGSQGLEELIKEYCYVCEAEVENTWIQGEQWLFATCCNGHSVSRCSISLLPCVAMPYYTCRTCRILAHPAFVPEDEPLCVFCDGILRPDESVTIDRVRP